MGNPYRLNGKFAEGPKFKVSCSMICKNNSMRNPLTAPFRNLTKTGVWKTWRRRVLKRDGFKCTQCSSTKQLQADHLIPVIQLINENRIKEIFDVDNGRTLCEECHKLTPTWGARGRMLYKAEQERSYYGL